jgi:methylated-DNA-protein-cysteine methyltransferase-like protein
MSSCYPKIYEVVRLIPYAQVATYGQVAELAGLIGKPRVVGYALYRVAIDTDIPWHRVINAQGKISESALRDGSDDLQKLLLEQEGIAFERGRIDFNRYRWRPSFAIIDQLLKDSAPGEQPEEH